MLGARFAHISGVAADWFLLLYWREKGTGKREKGDGGDEGTGNRQQGTGIAAAARPAYGGSQEEDRASALAPLSGELSAVRLTERSSPAACQISVCHRTEQLRYYNHFTMYAAAPSSQQRPSPAYRPPKAFPFRGRWQPEGLTEEVPVISISSIIMRRNPPHPPPQGQRNAARQIPLRHVRPGERRTAQRNRPVPLFPVACSLLPVPLSLIPHLSRPTPHTSLKCLHPVELDQKLVVCGGAGRGDQRGCGAQSGRNWTMSGANPQNRPRFATFVS